MIRAGCLRRDCVNIPFKPDQDTREGPGVGRASDTHVARFCSDFLVFGESKASSAHMSCTSLCLVSGEGRGVSSPETCTQNGHFARVETKGRTRVCP